MLEYYLLFNERSMSVMFYHPDDFFNLSHILLGYSMRKLCLVILAWLTWKREMLFSSRGEAISSVINLTCQSGEALGKPLSFLSYLFNYFYLKTNKNCKISCDVKMQIILIVVIAFFVLYLLLLMLLFLNITLLLLFLFITNDLMQSISDRVFASPVGARIQFRQISYNDPCS